MNGIGAAAVRLVAERELRQRLRERAFLVGTAISVVVVALAAFLPSVLGGGTTTFDVGAVGPDAVRVADGARRAGPALDDRVSVQPIADPARAERRLRDGDLDAVVLSGRILAEHELDDELGTLLQGAAARQRSAAALRARGLDAGAAQRVLAPPPLAVRSVEGRDEGSQGLALLAAFFLYGQIITYGIYVAMGVVEEKASRIVEILLATIRPRALLAGKIVGVGLVGLAQLTLVAVIGLGVGLASGSIDAGGVTLTAIAAVLGFFVLGYALYACLYAVAGALVSRQEDVQGATTPLTILLVVVFVLSFQALGDPSSTLAVVASIVPVSAPLIMPARIALGAASVPEVLAAVALTVACIALLVPLGGRLYAGAVLRTGGKVRLREAWRAAEQPA
jgi:ABC-2 type transport system permease protein